LGGLFFPLKYGIFIVEAETRKGNLPISVAGRKATDSRRELSLILVANIRV